MHKQIRNIFDGDSYCAIFTRLIYKRLVSRTWFTYADVMEDATGKPLTCNLTDSENYGELKKAFMNIKAVIGKENIESNGNNRHRSFRYVGEVDDPLANMRQAKAIKNIRRYYEFCQDSAGFFPISWLDYFLEDSLDLIDIKRRKHKGIQFISTSIDRRLENIELLPYLYEAIRNRRVLSIVYKPFDMPRRAYTFHPHFLKEYNGRWNLFGLLEKGGKLIEGYNVPIDRIIGKPLFITGKEFIPAPEHFYEHYFDDIVGVTHPKDRTVWDIHIRAYKKYFFYLTKTKPIHNTQTVSVEWGQHKDGEYGEFVLHVELNNELIGRIMMMEGNLEVVGPPEVRNVFINEVARLAKMYDVYSMKKDK